MKPYYCCTDISDDLFVTSCHFLFHQTASGPLERWVACVLIFSSEKIIVNQYFNLHCAVTFWVCITFLFTCSFLRINKYTKHKSISFLSLFFSPCKLVSKLSFFLEQQTTSSFVNQRCLSIGRNRRAELPDIYTTNRTLGIF